MFSATMHTNALPKHFDGSKEGYFPQNIAHGHRKQLKIERDFWFRKVLYSRLDKVAETEQFMVCFAHVWDKCEENFKSLHKWRSIVRNKLNRKKDDFSSNCLLSPVKKKFVLKI